jgi:hypothetical protein
MILTLKGKGKIFHKVKNTAIRELLVNHVQQIRGMIPSLLFIFEQLKYLDLAACILRDLSGYSDGKSIMISLYSHHNPNTSLILVELDEGLYQRYSWIDREKLKFFGYI